MLRRFGSDGAESMSVHVAALTDADLRTLMKGEAEDDRASAAHKVCRKIDRAQLTDEEREAAQQILRMLARDAAETVRRALSVTLRNSQILPRDVALKLARDVDSVALPVLAASPVFTDEDLIEVIRESGESKQVAVASRPLVPEAVAGVIAEIGARPAVEAAVANDNCCFAEAALQRLLDRFDEDRPLAEGLAHRRALPITVSERLVSLVSDEVREHLVNHHALSPQTALQIALATRERATVDLIDQAGRTHDPKGLAAQLNRHSRLTPSLLLRSLAHGHMTFFEWAVAELAGVPHHRTWLMIHDAGPLGLKAIYERAALPARLYPAFRSGVDAWRALESEGGATDRVKFQERMLQRFLTQHQSASREDLDYLLEKMDRLGEESRAGVAA